MQNTEVNDFWNAYDHPLYIWNLNFKMAGAVIGALNNQNAQMPDDTLSRANKFEVARYPQGYAI